MKLNLVVIVIAVLVAGSGVVYEVRQRAGVAPAAAICTPGPGEQCASEQFLKDYDKMVGIRVRVQKDSQTPAIVEVQDRQDQLTGIIDRLSRQVPQGYSFDDRKRRFIALPAPPPVISSPAPAAAP